MSNQSQFLLSWVQIRSSKIADEMRLQFKSFTPIRFLI